MTNPLFTPLDLGGIVMANRVVMAPLTRSRADDATDTPSELASTYYSRRASAGLIVSEATQISPMGKGYVATPGIYTDEHVRAWTEVTDAVHGAGGHMVLQLWHVGRVSHTGLLPGGRAPVSASAVLARAQSFLPDGPAPASPPVALDLEGIQEIIAEYGRAARLAKSAGFDGVEIHAANGYLIDQFIRDGCNRRTDEYGGSAGNRTRFAREVTETVLEVCGEGHVGIRLSPFGIFNDLRDRDPEGTFSAVIEALNPLGLAYLHMVEEFPFLDVLKGTEERPGEEQKRALDRLRSLWTGPYFANGGFDGALATEYVSSGRANAVSFGRPFISNPDLVERLRHNWPVTPADPSTFYGGGAQGYVDYPSFIEIDNAAQ